MLANHEMLWESCAHRQDEVLNSKVSGRSRFNVLDARHDEGNHGKNDAQQPSSADECIIYTLANHPVFISAQDHERTPRVLKMIVQTRKWSNYPLVGGVGAESEGRRPKAHKQARDEQHRGDDDDDDAAWGVHFLIVSLLRVVLQDI